MIIKTVNRPLQDEDTKPEDIQYPNESWCVKTYTYAEFDGGMKQWFKHLNDIEAKGCEIVYLYDIKAESSYGGFKSVVYIVRADYKFKDQ